MDKKYIIKDQLVLDLVKQMITGRVNTPFDWNHLIRKAKDGVEALELNKIIESSDESPSLDDDYWSY